MRARALILYRRRTGSAFWLVEAAIADGGDLVISSGDGEAEWQAIVRHANLPLLVAALPGSYPPWLPDDVLDLIGASFPRDDNAPNGPFEAIRRLLDANAIPYEIRCW